MNIDKEPGAYYNPKVYPWAFIVLLISMALYYHFSSILMMRPAGYHLWRQCDCISFAMNYYYNGMSFLKPSIHNLISDGGTTGLTMGEFPILYYFVALLWKIFGYHDFIYRAVVLLITFCGLFALYRTIEDFLKDSFWAIVLTLLVFTSPVIVYYATNFLTNMPAFALALIGIRYFYRFATGGKERLLWFSLIFFLLAALLKISAAISFVVVLFIFFTDITRIIRYRPDGRVFERPLRQGLMFVAVIALTAAWYMYSRSFNAVHGGNYTFNDLWPIWKIDHQNVVRIWTAFNNFLIHQLFNMPYIWITAFMLFCLLVFAALRKLDFRFMLIVMVLVAGTVSYFLFWYQAFDVHDYYMTDMILAFIVITVVFFYLLKTRFNRLFRNIFFRMAVTAFMIYGMFYAHSNISMRYFYNRHPPACYEHYTTAFESGLWCWYFDYGKKMQAPFTAITAYNRSVGIKPGDKVICLPDPSINITLALMNQPGWTNFGLTEFQGGARISKLKGLGAKYLFINDPELYNHEDIKPYLTKKIGSYMNVDIFDLQ